MGVNYNDERLVAVKQEEEQALNKSNTMYNSMIKDSQDYYDAQIDATKDWEKQQSQLQQEKTDFAIEQIEQEKDKANKDYVKEQSGSYVDWQKESNRYGANAEEMAASGFVASGYGESSQVRMYNTYQNRVATAREVFNDIILGYNNDITEARLQNSTILAEIANESLQKRLQLALEGLQYKNTLLETQANKQLEIKNMYQGKWQSVLDQINEENALAEQIRQFNQQLAEEKRQFNASYSLQQQQLAEEKRQFDAQNTVTYIDTPGGDTNVTNDGRVKYSDGRMEKPLTIQTKYYSGAIAKNVGNYGYMGKDNNGVAYQPKGIEIDGKAYKLDKTGKSAGQMFGSKATNSSGVNIAKQNVWKANGQYFIWNGTKNTYERVG